MLLNNYSTVQQCRTCQKSHIKNCKSTNKKSTPKKNMRFYDEYKTLMIRKELRDTTIDFSYYCHLSMQRKTVTFNFSEAFFLYDVCSF